MAVNYDDSLKTVRMTAVRDAIDEGSGAGYIEICSAAYASVLATIPLSDPCGAVSGTGTVVLTFSMPKSDAEADNSGTAAVARIKTSAGVVRVSGLTVGTADANIILDNITITQNQTVTINLATITHSA